MDMYTWIDYNKELWLTLEDFDKWPVGETYEVALFDRNFEEMAVFGATVLISLVGRNPLIIYSNTYQRIFFQV